MLWNEKWENVWECEMKTIHSQNLVLPLPLCCFVLIGWNCLSLDPMYSSWTVWTPEVFLSKPFFLFRCHSTEVLHWHGNTFFKWIWIPKQGEWAIKYLKICSSFFLCPVCSLSPYIVLLDRKLMKILEALTGMIQTFPLEDPQNQELEENMKQIRAKFRQVWIFIFKNIYFFLPFLTHTSSKW